MLKRILIIGAVLVILAGAAYGAYYWWQQNNAAALGSYQTTTISRGGLTATVGGTGTVRANQSTVIAWQTSGTVEAVLAQVGDHVAADQTLATLAQDSLAQNIILAQADLAASQKALENLQNSELALAQARLAISTTQQAVLNAQTALAVYDEQKYDDNLEKARDQVKETKDDLKTAQEDFEPYQDWDPDNQKRKDAQEKLDEAQLKYDAAVRTLTLLELEPQVAAANLQLAEAQHTEALREYERLKDGPDPRDLTAAQARVTAAEAALGLTSLEAPFAGTLTAVEVKPGDQATPGKTVFRLDDLSHLLVDVQISEVDINRIRVGQDVLLTFDAILNTEYHGDVVEVSSVGSTFQGAVEFKVTIELRDADELVRTGMTAAVNIVVEQLDNVLLVPNRAVRVTNGQRVVYVIRNNELVQVRITLGASSDTMSQVTDGNLLVGDAVVLNPPLTFDTNGPPGFAR
jgi:HlyD family secretion protein